MSQHEPTKHSPRTSLPLISLKRLIDLFFFFFFFLFDHFSHLSLFISLTVSLSIIALYISNYALFCRAAHSQRGSSRILLFGDPQLEGNHRIMREGWKGEFSVALDDLFMSHVACNALKHFLPTHVVVLGRSHCRLSLTSTAETLIRGFDIISTTR